MFVFILITIVVGFLEGFGITLFLPFLSQTSITTQSSDGMSSFIRNIFSSLGIPMSAGIILVAMLVVFILKGTLTFVQAVYQAHLTARLTKDIRLTMLAISSEMEYSRYSTRNTGYFANLITQEVTRAVDFFNRYAMVISYIFTLISFLVLSLFLNWQFTAFALIAGMVTLYALKYFSRLSGKYSRETSLENAVLQSLLIQTLQAFKYLKSTAAYSRVSNRLSQSISRVAHLEFKVASASSVVHGFSEPLIMFFLIAVLYILVVVQGQSSAPIFVAIMLFYRMLQAITQFQKQWQNVSAVMGGIDTVIAADIEIRKYKEHLGNRNFEGIRTAIEFQNVDFSYIEEKPLFHGLDLTISKNTTVAFVGESGAGKSTIVDLLTGLLKPQNGGVFADGINLQDIESESYRKKIGYVTQEWIAFDDSVANNIGLWSGDWSSPGIESRIRQAARRAYCEDFIENMPDGFLTVIGDRGVKLSGGQRQRLSIARELFKEPDILILDEATSALDTESEQFIQKSIDGLKGKMTVVIIAHRLSTIKNADYIFVLEKGQLVEQGKLKELLANGNSKFAQMCALQNIT